jgi:hypothetical protein
MLVPEAAAEALDEGVIHRLPWPCEVEPHGAEPLERIGEKVIEAETRV